MNYRQFKNLTIKGSAEYEQAVHELLDTLWASWTGWAVIRQVVDTGKQVTIVPLLNSEVTKELGMRRAFAMPKNLADATPRGAELFRGGADDPATKEDERFKTYWGRGTGKGTDCQIHYSPEDYAVLPMCSKTVTTNCVPSYFTRDRGADTILIHELTHALREMKGQSYRMPTWYQDYDNQEEFFATLVQNIYASERAKKALTADHHGGVLAPELATSDGFFGRQGQRPISMLQLENRLLVSRFISENPDLCHDLITRGTAPFNPIKEMIYNPGKYPYDPKLTWPLRRL
jgi:hypothetical protein